MMNWKECSAKCLLFNPVHKVHFAHRRRDTKQKNRRFLQREALKGV